MQLPDALRDALRDHLEHPVENCAAVGGGCIAHACRLETEEGRFFLKWGRGEVARTFPGEAAGLRALRAAESPVQVARVLAEEPESDGVPGYLLMEWIPSGRRRDGFWETFGEGLAVLHRHTADEYGFETDNYIGATPQTNTWMTSWVDFYREQRLEPQVDLARTNAVWAPRWNAALEALYRRLPDLLPLRPPASILHGDLWKGNFMVSVVGTPVLVDPATYYGHRETDLALTELFGGFRPGFYEAYRSAWPLAPGYEERRSVYNLYHLINHLNLFGRSYAGQVEATLEALA